MLSGLISRKVLVRTKNYKSLSFKIPFIILFLPITGVTNIVATVNEASLSYAEESAVEQIKIIIVNYYYAFQLSSR